MPTDSLYITLFIHHIQRFSPRLRSHTVVRCSCPLDAAVTLLPSPWCSAVCPTDATSRTTDVCAGGPFSLRRTFQHWYELHYLTESLQYFIQFLYFTLIESLLLNCPGFVQPSYEYDNSSFNLEDLDNLDADDRDVLGSSQLGGAPPLRPPCALHDRRRLLTIFRTPRVMCTHSRGLRESDVAGVVRCVCIYVIMSLYFV